MEQADALCRPAYRSAFSQNRPIQISTVRSLDRGLFRLLSKKIISHPELVEGQNKRTLPTRCEIEANRVQRERGQVPSVQRVRVLLADEGEPVALAPPAVEPAATQDRPTAIGEQHADAPVVVGVEREGAQGPHPELLEELRMGPMQIEQLMLAHDRAIAVRGDFRPVLIAPGDDLLAVIEEILGGLRDPDDLLPRPLPGRDGRSVFAPGTAVKDPGHASLELDLQLFHGGQLAVVEGDEVVVRRERLTGGVAVRVVAVSDQPGLRLRREELPAHGVNRAIFAARDDGVAQLDRETGGTGEARNRFETPGKRPFEEAYLF